MPVTTSPGGTGPDAATTPTQRTAFWPQAGYYLVGGGLSTVGQAVVFLLLRELVETVAANLLAVAITTLASTTFHRRITFAGSISSPRRRWIQSGLTFAFYASYNSIVLTTLGSVVANPSPLLESATLTTFAIFGGVCRFLLMRWWVFHFRHRT